MSWQRIVAVALVGATVATVMTLMGFDAVNIVLATAATAVLAAVTGHREIGDELSWPVLAEEPRGGQRHEVSQISWSLTDKDGRVADHGLRRLRAVAAGRLTLAGIDPDDDDAVRARLGERALRTLRATRENRPTVRALDACLTALDDLEGAPDDH